MPGVGSPAFLTWWQRWCLVAILGYAVRTIPGVGPDHAVNALDGTWQVAISLSCALLCLLRARAAGTAGVWAWAAGALLAEASAKAYLFTLAGVGFRSGVSLTDMLIFVMFGQLIVAFSLYGLRQRRRMGTSADLDGLLTGCGLVTLLLALGSPWIERMLTGDDTVDAVIVGYVVVQAVLLVEVAIILAVRGWQVSRECVIMLAILGCGCVWMALATLLIHAHSGDPLDNILEARTLLIALLAGQPSGRARRDDGNGLVIGIPLLMSAVAVAVLVAGSLRPITPLALAGAAGTVLLALGRLAVSYRELAAADHLRVLAETDELTGLPNRRGFFARGTELCAVPGTALLLIDLDKFKFVNDTMGHAVGDDLLREVARRLDDIVGDHLLARLGGDEFAALMPAREAEGFGARLARALGEPIVLDGAQLRIGASVGVALNPDHGQDIPRLLQLADVALYRAKERGGVVVYSPLGAVGGEAREQTRDDALLLAELRDAIAGDTLTVHYQPIVSTTDRRLVSAEALVRWNHPARGLLAPADFLPLVRENRLMDQMTMSVLRIVVAQGAALLRRGTPVPISLNLFPPTLGDLDLPGRIGGELERGGLPPELLIVEITEEFMLRDPDRSASVLRELRDMGIGISVDDFGTGFSALAYLHQLPITTVKIDRAFVGEISHDARAAALTRSVVDLAHGISLVAVAEGVDSAETFDQLATIGCDMVQGFFISRPVLAAELEEWAGRSSQVHWARRASSEVRRLLRLPRVPAP
ncbi:MAG: bifunctional diguanylate cyclase/phosphodiesterase [Nocardioides sp.]|uniref:putative bifunctional diguanylate cyclase/phosphodiesterase n=1 Tax=Nocardioides sp. TaxID=35761 RepID=UPI0039E382F2